MKFSTYKFSFLSFSLSHTLFFSLAFALIFCFQPCHFSSEPLLPPSTFQTHSLRRFPHCPAQCQPLHISHPIPITLGLGVTAGVQTPPPIPPHRPLPRHTQSPVRASPFFTLPRQPVFMANQVRHAPQNKPSIFI